jgi:uncharacterized caspase-like protein
MDCRFLFKPNYHKKYAIVIGINKYATVSPLEYAINDAQEIKASLIESLGFEEDNVKLLVDEEATKNSILSNYLRFTRNDIEVDDCIIFFFAGHGHTITGVRGEVGYLIPHDANINDYSTLIRWDEITRNAELIRAKHMLFIMDACYGGLALTRNAHPGSTRFLKDMFLRFSRQVLTAGKADEVVADSGGPIPNHSVFTGHLLQGIRGAAATADGIITANSLMSYVYGKVSKDVNSHQTPHYGYFDGDGDYILKAPQLSNLEEKPEEDRDKLIVVPITDEINTILSTTDKINRIKELLSEDKLTIKLHDFLIIELKALLSSTSEDNFKIQGQYSKVEFIRRLNEYEHIADAFALLIACVAYWGKNSHFPIMQKAIARTTDHLERSGGLTVWLNLRWFPQIITLYASGIASVEGNRYDSMYSLFFTPTYTVGSEETSNSFVESVASAFLELNRTNVFKELPGHERHYTPISEYLYKIIQPKLDDTFFVGKGYEDSFDTFESLFALVIADLNKQKGRGVWGPVGRFGWKYHRGRYGSPLERILKQASDAGAAWGPLKAGFFGGSLERLKNVADEYSNMIGKLNWW